ncbi:MAG: hypothetical protein CK425_02550 [Parachlamydia sp.]|nr:MAG: hypothetical protein CK425_02550 [Parachlamydia sp.]
MAIKLPFVIEVPKRHQACMLGVEPFVPGMNYCSILIKNEETSDFERLDYCLKCWEKEGKIPDGNVSYWKSKVPQEKMKENAFTGTHEEKALELFKQAMLENSDDDAFILALWLVRKKKLILRHCFHDQSGQEIYLYEDPATEETFSVRKIALSNEKVLELQARLAKSLR